MEKHQGGEEKGCGVLLTQSMRMLGIQANILFEKDTLYVCMHYACVPVCV